MGSSLAFASALILSVPSFVQASAYTHNHLDRRLVVPANPSGTWTSQGCYTDNAGGVRTLGGAQTANGNMTPANCIAFCTTAPNNFIYSGVEYSQECYCGNSLLGSNTNATLSDCNMPCSGDNTLACGAGNRLNLYWSGAQPPAGPVTNPGVGNWKSLGCYSDAAGSRTLPVGMGTNGGVTTKTCTDACFNAGYKLAGTEYSAECYCANTIAGSGAPTPLADCSMTCQGNSSEFCGGPNRLNLYGYDGTVVTPPPDNPPPTGGPVTNPGVGDWKSLGCYSDVVGARTLPFGLATNGQVTTKTCTDACFNAGYPLAGTEYSVECYCGTAIGGTGAATPLADCAMTCQGNSSEFCGGPNRLNMYNYTGTALPTTPGNPPPPPPPPGNGNVSPVYSGLPGTWNYSNCYLDNAYGRVFGLQLPDDNTMTINKCVAACDSRNYTLAGVEYGVQCFCGNMMINGATVTTGCNMQCGGNSTQACGDGNRLSVYSKNGNITIIPPPVIKKTDLPTGYSYAGCIREPGAERVLPYQIEWPGNNTVDACVSRCRDFGYPAAGLEYSQECWCGDITDIQKNGGVLGADSECSMPCDGDPYHICGGVQRLTVYTHPDPLDVWHTPANTGRYEFLIGGLVIPLIATVGINNKVTFLEKSGTSAFPNSTGAYELDLSLVGDYKKAWREMHVKSDVFCAASLILPDKAGRQINIGGWSLDSTKGVRLYTPDGSTGVNGTNDWEENFEVLHLQRQRWYPSAVLLTNGSILVVGGELGSNDKPEPSLEILPQPAGGPTYLNMSWLERTDPWNLYPFLFILPTERVFVGYYNEARILDPATFATVQEFPNIPAAVNNFNGGRTYPMEGAAVMFPQYAPYTDPVTILMCGGSTIPAMIALDNCASIQPEAANPQWLIERMPSKRVLACMAPLPDGTFFIANGAHQGHAGFGLANDPNYQALIYDPSQPPHQRISMLNSTIVARMYHSEATLLPDGRVLISGSDPNPDGVQVYPEEFRVEVYVPPYLSSGLKQPEYTITQRDWTYGGQYQLTNVKLYQGAASGVRVSMVAATSSTHGAIMGGRTLFPAVSCSGTTCTVTAPPTKGICPPGWFMLFVLDGPTPSHAQWIRIGGDPGQLGLWPNLPGFTPPGMGPIAN